jgi:hypothetical protein
MCLQLIFTFFSPTELILLASKLSQSTRGRLREFRSTEQYKSSIEKYRSVIKVEQKLFEVQEWHSNRKFYPGSVFTLDLPKVPLSRFGSSS